MHHLTYINYLSLWELQGKLFNLIEILEFTLTPFSGGHQHSYHGWSFENLTWCTWGNAVIFPHSSLIIELIPDSGLPGNQTLPTHEELTSCKMTLSSPSEGRIQSLSLPGRTSVKLCCSVVYIGEYRFHWVWPSVRISAWVLSDRHNIQHAQCTFAWHGLGKYWKEKKSRKQSLGSTVTVTGTPIIPHTYSNSLPPFGQDQVVTIGLRCTYPKWSKWSCSDSARQQLREEKYWDEMSYAWSAPRSWQNKVSL